jgi:predicted permease
MTVLSHDLLYALRQLRKSPGFATVALLTLALCLGANLTIFAVIDSILLRPLPFPEPDRLVVLYNTYPKAGKERDLASITNYYERRGNIPAFSSLASLNLVTVVLGEAGATERVPAGRVTPEFFSTLGVPLAMGRVFTDAEMTYQTDNEIILTDTYWRQHFNADRNVIGRDVRSDGILRKIVGVLPPNFRFLSTDSQIYLPLSSEDGEHNLGARHNNSVIEIARLKPGFTLGEAQAQIDAHNATHAAEFPLAKEVADTGFRTIVAGLHADHVASIRPTLLLLQAGALFLLLIGAVNLANLLLIRASGRAKELAVRQSMGASRWRVLSQVSTETILLCLIGGVGGIAVGALGIRLLAALGTDRLPLGANIVLDRRAALVVLAGSLLVGVLIAIPIAWFNLRSHLASALQSESRAGTTSASAQRLRYGFIVAQIALAFVLLSGSALLGLSLRRVMTISPGFRTDHVIAGALSLPWKSYRDVSTFLTLANRLMDETSHQPGVTAAGMISNIPLNGPRDSSVINVLGYKPAPGESAIVHPVYGVFGNYFSAMGVALRDGRFLDTADSGRPELVCVVDEDFARRYWPQGGVVGQRLGFGSQKNGTPNVYTIVGVVGAVKQTDLTERDATGAVYFPYSRFFSRNYFVVARTSFQPESLAIALRKIVRDADPDLPLSDLRSMETRVDDSLVSRRSPALLTAIFASVALLLAAIGTYGVVSYAVAQRQREIGVRMALGALPKQVLGQFLKLGAELLAVGATLGVAGAWAAGRAMQKILFEVSPVRADVLAATLGVMALVVVAACFVPARRAAKVDPMIALRYE